MLRRRMYGGLEKIEGYSLCSPEDFNPDLCGKVNNPYPECDVNVINIFNTKRKSNGCYIYSLLPNIALTHTLPNPIGTESYMVSETIGSNTITQILSGDQVSVSFTTGSKQRWIIVNGKVTNAKCQNNGVFLFSGKCKEIHCEKNTNLEFVYYHDLNDNYIFDGCSELKGIVSIPKTTQMIISEAFRQCKKITNLQLNKELKGIGVQSFLQCTLLNGDLVIPKTVESIGQSAFSGCTGFNGNLIFEHTDSDPIRIINYCFRYCKFKGNLNLPKETHVLGQYAFDTCSNFTSLALPNNTTLTSIGPACFIKCGFIGELTIPNNINKIGSSCFRECKQITNVKFNDNIKIIEESTFEQCTGLNQVLKLPKNLEKMKFHAFYLCKNIPGYLDIPNTVNELGVGVFNGCSSLTNIHIPNNSLLKFLNTSLFAYCTSINNAVVIPNNIEGFRYDNGEGTFASSNNIPQITLSANIKYINNAFAADTKDDLITRLSWKGNQIIECNRNQNGDVLVWGITGPKKVLQIPKGEYDNYIAKGYTEDKFGRIETY